MLKKIDTKTLIIILLTSLLLIFGWLQPNQRINYYKDELKDLRISNDSLMKVNDSLRAENKKIDIEITKLKSLIMFSENLIKEYSITIDYLKNKKNEIPGKVNVLNADMVANQFTSYLKRRSSKNVHK